MSEPNEKTVVKKENRLLSLLAWLAGISILTNFLCVFVTVVTVIITLLFHIAEAVVLLAVALEQTYCEEPYCERKDSVLILLKLDAFLCCCSLMMAGSIIMDSINFYS